MNTFKIKRGGHYSEKSFEYNGWLVLKERQPKLIDFFRYKKVIKWWIGTDALTMATYPPGDFRWHVRIFFRRIWYRIIESFIYQHWFVAEHLANSIRVAENKKYLVVDPPIIATKIKKKKHDGFNVLYYFPSITKNIKFKKWLYGFDIFEYTREQLFPQLNYIVVDGSQNMTEIYPIVDFYLRPTRHDGHSRMIDECQINNIPYYQGRTLHYIIQVLNESIRNNNSI